MRRVQVQLTESQHEALRREAVERGEGLATMVRRAVDAWIASSDRARRAEQAVQAIGGFRSGRDDVSERHDDHLVEAFAAKEQA